MRVASAIRVGMKADEVLKMRGRSDRDAVADPSLEGRDKQGLIIVWHYFDCDVVLQWRNGCVRVKEVRDGS